MPSFVCYAPSACADYYAERSRFFCLRNLVMTTFKTIKDDYKCSHSHEQNAGHFFAQYERKRHTWGSYHTRDTFGINGVIQMLSATYD